MSTERLHKIVDGKKVYLTAEQEKALRSEWEKIDAAKAELKRLTDYMISREQNYPKIGDQLDAILKQLNYDRMQGRELVQDMDDIISRWLQVKQEYPKPDAK